METDISKRASSESLEEALEKHGVERVVLLDSYLPRSRSEVRIDGHTAVTGKNSTGKTSLIRLLPIFFGAEPRQLIKPDSSGQMLSFSRYYLPRQGSYVVFEYRTHAGLNLAVFTTHNNTDKLKITLVSGAYDDALFLDANDRFLNKDELVQRARAAGHITHVFDSIKAYRALVLGSAVNRGRSHDQRRFNVLVGYPNHAKRSLEDVHAILCATLDNKVDERLLRKLLFEQAVREAGVGVEGLTRINLSTEDLEGWLGNFRGLATMRDRAADADAVLDVGKAFRVFGYREAVLRQALDERANAIGESLESHTTTLSTREVERNELENEHTGQKREHDEIRQEHRARELDNKGEKESLERRKRMSERDGIHEKLRLAETYEEKESAHRQANGAYQALKSRSANIDQEIDRLIEGAKRDYDQSIEHIEADRERIDKEAALGRAELDHAQVEVRRSLEEHLATEGERLSNAESDANREHATAKTALETVGAAPEIVEKRDEARQQKDDAETKRRAVEKTEQGARQTRDSGLDALGKLRKKQFDLAQRKKAREGEQSEIAERLQREGTLLEFVRENVKNWEGTIAATLNRGTDLLYAKDLKPEVAKRTEQSFFGVMIDTSRLDPNDVDRREKERLVGIERELTALKGDIDAVERELRRANVEQRELDRICRETERQRTLLDSRVESAEQALKQAEAQVDKSRQTRRKCFEETFEVARTRLNRAREDLREFRQRAKSEREELEKRQIEAVSEFDGGIVARRHHCAERKSDAKARRSANIGRLDDIRRQRRSEAGVSVEDLESARRAEQGTAETLDEARRATHDAANWNALMEEIGEKMPGLERAIAEAQEAIGQLERRWGDYETGYSGRYEACQRAIGEAKTAIEQLNIDRSKINVMLAQSEILGTSGALDRATVAAKAELDIVTLQQEWEALREELTRRQRDLYERLREFERLFVRTESAMCRSFAESRNFSFLVGSDDPEQFLAAVEALREFFGDPPQWGTSRDRFPSESYGGNVEAVIRGWISTKLELGGFVNSLRALKREVARQNSAIKTHYDAMLSHLDSIDSINVEASFNLEQIDGYSAAQDAVDALNRFDEQRNASGDDQLVPGPDVAHALKRLLEYLKTRRYDQRVDLVDALQMRFVVTRQGGTDVRRSQHGQPLADAFSTGIGTLVAVIVLVGFLESMRKRLPVTIPWMLDEILRLDEENTRGLLYALERQRIFLVSTSTDIRPELDASFSRRFALQSVAENGSPLATPVFVELPIEVDRRDPFDVLAEPDDSGLAAVSEERAIDQTTEMDHESLR